MKEIQTIRKETADKALISSCVRYVDKFGKTKHEKFVKKCLYYVVKSVFGTNGDSEFVLMAMSFGMMMDIFDEKVDLSPAYVALKAVEKSVSYEKREVYYEVDDETTLRICERAVVSMIADERVMKTCTAFGKS